jgi:ubiquinone/menaquinone biosynthesis C-methylase UbiE
VLSCVRTGGGKLTYDAIAERYDDFVRQSVIHRVALPALLELCQPPGQTVLDLGCGQGVLARALAARGDVVTGVDISQSLLEIARGIDGDEPLGITYLQDDATVLAKFSDAFFDGVASSLTFSDLDDLEGVMTSIHRVLKAEGWFAFAALHPCFEPPHAHTFEVDGRPVKQVNGYFEEGPWRSKNRDGLLAIHHHRRLSTVLNMLIETGFVIDRLAEPPGVGRALALAPIYGEVAEVLVVRARRMTSGK